MRVPVLRRYQEMLRGLDAPWCIGGGWACDVWAGRQSRDHADVDIVIWRQDQLAVRSFLQDWRWETYSDGKTQTWDPGTWLQLPFHNAHGRKGPDVLELLMIEREGGDWWYRRDPRVRMQASQAMLTTPSGLQVLNPAIALLFKSKHVKDKDRHDLAILLPAMRKEDRQWLKAALLLAHPLHDWIGQL